MEIIKYAAKNCVKCRVLDNVFRHVTLPCEVTTRYAEDESDEQFILEGITSLPTLVLKNNDEIIMLKGTITPAMINEAIEKLNG